MCGGGVIIYTPPWRITHLGSCAAAAREKNVDLRVSHFSLWSPKFIASGSECGHKGARFSLIRPFCSFFAPLAAKIIKSWISYFLLKLAEPFFPFSFSALCERDYMRVVCFCAINSPALVSMQAEQSSFLHRALTNCFDLGDVWIHKKCTLVSSAAAAAASGDMQPFSLSLAPFPLYVMRIYTHKMRIKLGALLFFNFFQPRHATNSFSLSLLCVYKFFASPFTDLVLISFPARSLSAARAHI